MATKKTTEPSADATKTPAKEKGARAASPILVEETKQLSPKERIVQAATDRIDEALGNTAPTAGSARVALADVRACQAFLGEERLSKLDPHLAFGTRSRHVPVKGLAKLVELVRARLGS